MKTVPITLIFLLLLLSPRIAMACSCAGKPSICGSFAEAEAVFVGSIARLENKTVKFPNGTEGIGSQVAYVQVEETFKGVKATELVFRTYGTSCDPLYQEGQRWLFYAYYNKESNAWVIGGCGRSTPIEWAADDLLYLRALPGSGQKTRLSGVLRNFSNQPLIGIKVKLIGERESYEVFTDKNGVYEAYGLPAGKYSIKPETPLNLKVRYTSRTGEVDGTDRNTMRVVLKEKSCAGADYTFSENTSIKGRVFSSDGRTLPNVCLDLKPKAKQPVQAYLSDCTDADGRFKIDDIPLGEYLLVANEQGRISSYHPFPAVYYPGVFEKEKATAITFASGDQLEDFDLHVPSQQPTKTIEGKLLFSDKRPVANESVTFESDAENGMQAGTVHTKTDADGRFSLPALDGTSGSLRGFILIHQGMFENCPAVDKLLKAKGQSVLTIETNALKLEVNRDFQNLELVFPFPYCAKAKLDPN